MVTVTKDKNEFKKRLKDLRMGEVLKFEYIKGVVAEVSMVPNGYLITTPFWEVVSPTAELVLTNLVFYH